MLVLIFAGLCGTFLESAHQDPDLNVGLAPPFAKEMGGENDSLDKPCHASHGHGATRTDVNAGV
jgi:hypothetical protein